MHIWHSHMKYIPSNPYIIFCYFCQNPRELNNKEATCSQAWLCHRRLTLDSNRMVTGLLAEMFWFKTTSEKTFTSQRMKTQQLETSFNRATNKLLTVYCPCRLMHDMHLHSRDMLDCVITWRFFCGKKCEAWRALLWRDPELKSTRILYDVKYKCRFFFSAWLLRCFACSQMWILRVDSDALVEFKI